MATTGKILRFDEVRGYGFISPDDGDEDVFMHANDLWGEKILFRSGVRVEFEIETSDKGLKASSVRIVHAQPASVENRRPDDFRWAPRLAGNGVDNGKVSPDANTGQTVYRPGDSLLAEEEETCDVLSATDFQRELAEALLAAVPSLTGTQVVSVRESVLNVAKNHNWVESDSD